MTKLGVEAEALRKTLFRAGITQDPPEFVAAAIVEQLGITEEAIAAVDSGNWESEELRYRATMVMRKLSFLLELANHE